MNRLISSLILLITISSGCTINNPAKDDNIMVSSDNITFENNGGELRVQVLTSTMEWLISSPDESRWLEFGQIGDSLLITASPNMGDARVSYILIHAGSASKKIKVNQVAAGTTVMLDRDAVNFPVNGGKTIIRLSGYAGDITFSTSPDASWLSYHYDAFRQELVISTNEINNEFMRSATVVVKNDSEVKDITVTQRGVKSWFIPIQVTKGSTRAMREVINQETARENRFLSQSQDGRYTILKFESLSPLFSDIRYTFTKNTNYVSAMANFLYKDKEQLDAYIEALIRAKYQVVPERTTDTTKTLVSEDGKEIVTIDINDLFAVVTFVHEEEQPQPYPSFSSFPFNEDALGSWTTADIAAYERTLGNNAPTYHQGNDYYYQRPDYKGYTFLYTMDDSGHLVKAWLTSGSNFHEAVWVSGKGWKLTAEFKALITKNGYTLTSSSAEKIVYTNADKKTDLSISYQKHAWGDYLEINIQKAE